MVEEVIGGCELDAGIDRCDDFRFVHLRGKDSRCRNSWRHNAAAEGCKYPVHTHAFA